MKDHISICVCTYKRPRQLELLLCHLEKQETNDLFAYSIVVADNDVDESAKIVVDEQSKKTRINIKYHVEKKQNIALARNMAIRYSDGDYIALIDDDEIPSRNWLLIMYITIKRYNVSGILGPVIPIFEMIPPKWVIRGRVFERPNHNTGTILTWSDTRTGNVLLTRNIFDRNEIWFQEKYGSGGEDRDYFRRMIDKRNEFIWCAEAPVYEIIPNKRWKIIILIKRALLRGKMANKAYNSKMQNLYKSIIATIIYAISLPLLLLTSPIIGYEIFMEYLVKMFDHVGVVLGKMNIEIIKVKYII